MPIRLLRPGITTSRHFNALDWMAQSFYIRLITLVDDYGRMEADHELLASLVFPKHRDVQMTAIAGICQQLIAENMVLFYEVDGTKYLQLSKWKERARSESRFPSPICGHLPANDSKCLQMIASPPSPSPSPSPSPIQDAPRPVALRFVKPLREELDLAASKCGLPVSEVDKFVNYYESNGWRVGKNPMRSWPSALANWRSRWEENRKTSREYVNPRNPSGSCL